MLFIILLIKYLLTILPLLLAVAFLTLIERKVLAAVQKRKGPNIVGLFGLFQPFADALKLLAKEIIIPFLADKILFISAPLVTFILTAILWCLIPYNLNGFVLSNIELSILFIFGLLSLNVYGVIIAGWASNSRYAFLGALRSAAQMLSYEVSFGLSIAPIFLVAESVNLIDIIVLQQNSLYFVFLFFPNFILFVIHMLAETNRTPFDLPEAEAELVSGYNVEYSSIGFALFFIAEYSSILFMSTLCVVLFFGGWDYPFYEKFYKFFYELYIGKVQIFFELSIKFVMYKLLLIMILFILDLLAIFSFIIKIIFIIFIFLWARALLPRYRYDQLMYNAWNKYLPISLALLCFYFFLFEFLDFVF